MAIISGLQINTTGHGQRSEQVILTMESLIRARYHQQVSRKVFLIKWSALRKRLLITPEYQALIVRVRQRAGEVCEGCNSRSGEHVHHKDPVAFAPRRALIDSNCLWVCIECHEDEDKLARRAAMHRKRAYGSGEPPRETAHTTALRFERQTRPAHNRDAPSSPAQGALMAPRTGGGVGGQATSQGSSQ